MFQPNDPRFNNGPSYLTSPPQSYNYMTIVPVDGETNMSMYPVGPGNTVFLIDFNTNKLWIKSKDVNGIPLPTQKYKLSPEIEMNAVQNQNADKSANEYVTTEQFNKLLNVVTNLNNDFNNLMKELSPNSTK